MTSSVAKAPWKTAERRGLLRALRHHNTPGSRARGARAARTQLATDGALCSGCGAAGSRFTAGRAALAGRAGAGARCTRLAGWPAASLARRFSVEFQRFLIMLSVLRAGRSACSRSAGAPAVPRAGRGSREARLWKAGWRGEQGSVPPVRL
jgi:hypothetical protein